MADKPVAFLPLPLPSIGDTAPSQANAVPSASASEAADPDLEEVGQDFETTMARIREIEAKALRKLRDPERSARLQAFDEDDDDADDEDDDDGDDDDDDDDE